MLGRIFKVLAQRQEEDEKLNNDLAWLMPKLGTVAVVTALYKGPINLSELKNLYEVELGRLFGNGYQDSRSTYRFLVGSVHDNLSRLRKIGWIYEDEKGIISLAPYSTKIAKHILEIQSKMMELRKRRVIPFDENYKPSKI